MTTTAACTGCGRKLTAAASITRGMGKVCAARDLTAKRAEAARIAAIPFGNLIIPARKLIDAGRLTPVGTDVWKAGSSTDERRTYIATAFSCECRAAAFGNLCHHRCAAAMTSACQAVA